MDPLVFSILLTAVRLGLKINKYLKRQKLHPDQWEQLKAANKESFEKAGNSGTGVNE